MPKSMQHIPRREVIAIVVTTAVVMAAVIALLPKVGLGLLLIV